MADTLFINEEFFKKNISHRQTFNSAQVISTIRLVQKTNLISIITLPIYENFQTKINDAVIFSVAEANLFDSVQLYLAVKTAEEMLYSAPNDDKDNKEGASLAYHNKCVLLEARIVRDINRDSTLLALAQSGSDDFDDEEMDVQGGFYFG